MTPRGARPEGARGRAGERVQPGESAAQAAGQGRAAPSPERSRPDRPAPRALLPRIGAHLSTAGGVFRAAERAQEIGAGTFQIFSSSPRMWRPAQLAAEHCERMGELRARFDIAPAVIHASYLINVAAQSAAVWENSIAALRGELERAFALGAEYLVLHPGSWRGLTRSQGLARAAEAIARASDALPSAGCDFRLLIENTAGAEFSLGGSLEQVAELIERLRPVTPVAACLDTCHCHVAGYDLVSAAGYEETAALIGRLLGFDAVRVWHMNDAKAARGSKLDRHEHIGEGTLGVEPFRRLLRDARFAHAAFIAETPIDEPGDDARNVAALRSLAARPK